MDDIVIQYLTPMFPQLTPDVIRLSVRHASNRDEPLDEGHLLQRCIDDLLELRTYSLERTSEGPRDGSQDGDVVVTGVRPGNIQCQEDVILISDSPVCDYSNALSTRPPSSGETGCDRRLTVDTSPQHVPTGDTVGGPRPSVSHRPTHSGTHGQSTSAHSDDDTDLPDIMSPMARRNSSTVSFVTHQPTLASYFPSASSHKAPSTSHDPAAATHNASAATCHTPAAATHNASAATCHIPAAATHNASAATFHTPAAATHNASATTFHTPAATTHTASAAAACEKAIASSANIAETKTVPLSSTDMASAKTVPLPSTDMAGAKTVPLPSTDMAGAKTVPLPSTDMAGAKTVPLPSTDVPSAKTVPLTSNVVTFARTVLLASTSIAGTKTVPSTSTVGTANVTIPTASNGTASALAPGVKPTPQAPAEIPVTVPLVEPSTSQAQPKSHEERLEELTQEVCCVFTDADWDYVKDLLRHSFYPDPVNAICNYMLEANNYLRVKKPDPIPLPGPSTSSFPPASPLQSSVTRTSGVNYYKDKQPVTSLYRLTCITQLQYEFKKIAYKSINQVASAFNYHYAPTRRVLTEATEHFAQSSEQRTLTVTQSSGNITKVHVMQLKGMRKYKCPVDISVCPELHEEVSWVKQADSVNQKTVDKPEDISMSEDLFEDTDATIECGCCYGDCCFENMVQCADGHLFCRKCVENYTRESVFGQGKATLVCMTESCEATFPKSQLEVALPADLLSQFESRMQEEAINMADMTDLVRCPHCDYAAILDPGDKVFVCSKCYKETCRYCKEDWAEHIGIPCVELEKKDETKIRLAFEEKMTEAKIRVCHRCKARFTKLDGCNKMTCRCGARMCYICRKPDIDYIHFCQHVRDPGKGCKKCNDCSLWTNPDEDEERAIVELKKEAQLARREQGYTDDKVIGASCSPVKKKRRIK